MKAATAVAAALQNPKVQPAQKTVPASGLLSMCPGDDSAIAWMADSLPWPAAPSPPCADTRAAPFTVAGHPASFP